MRPHIIQTFVDLKRYLSAAPLFMALFVVGCGDQVKSNSCKRKVVAEINSSDLSYVAQAQQVVCASGAEVTYSVLVRTSEKAAKPWTVVIPLESDSRDRVAPMLSWGGKRTLVIEIRTRTLQGNLQMHIGEDLLVERRFVASEPSAFPNFY